MQHTKDHDLVAARLVENEIVSKAGDGAGPDPGEFAKGVSRAEVGIFRNEGKGLLCCSQQAVRRIQIVGGDVVPVS